MKTVLPGCSAVTPKKWERLEDFLSYHMEMARGAMAKNASWANQTYQYIDLYAGPGIYRERHNESLAGRKGSPLIALDAAAEQGVDVQAFLVESKFHEELKASIEECGYGDRASVFAGHCGQSLEWIFDQVPVASYGLIFVDPNGYPDWSALERLTRRYRQIDVMVNVNATSIKRCLMSPLDGETRRPTDYLRSMNKVDIKLWSTVPGDKHQFCLAYLTNKGYGEWKKRKFFSIDKSGGREIARFIDHTAEELKSMPAPGGFLAGLRF